MNFTFGIITNNGHHINDVANSIRRLNIDNYEIVIVGKSDSLHNNSDIKFIEFEDPSVNFSISEKKNLITDNSRYENIVYLHDYIELDAGWYESFLEFGEDFEVCMSRIINQDGSRYRDWCLWRDDADKFVSNGNYLIPYEIKNLSKMMYISGAYWVAKKQFMLDNRLNERLKWRQGEDVEWSLRVRNKTEFKINQKSSVHLLKQKERIFGETTPEENSLLKTINDYDNSDSYEKLLKYHLGGFIQ
jgi:hypothetical protein